jgi:hypothetical protein
VVDAPSTITGLADVQVIIAKHTQLARDAGLSFDHMAVKYVATEQRWFLVPVDSGGTTIAGWLEIADPTSQSGWRFGEQPTWDSQYHPSTDTYQYGLPALHEPANHFELGFANGFPILIEVTPSSTPQYWNNIVQKTTLLVEGAVLPTETPPPTLVPTLGPLPSNNDPQLPFPGYKQENYTDGWNILKDSWNPLWTKWQLMAADQLGPGGSLVVRPVEGEAGIDCEDAVDGSYKGMTFCPPLDFVNGGFLPFPGIDSAANTDYHPLFIERSSQYARLKSVGTGTSLVLQEVDSQGNPTRYIKPKNDADGNGGVWVAGEYVAPIEYPATDHILSPEELAAKKLYGSGFELKTEFQGIPVDLTVVTSKATLAQYDQTRGCMPNQEMVKYGASAEDRMAEMVFLGHYVGYLRDKGLTEANYTFEQYTADLKAGADRSYTIWGPRLDGSDGEFMVNPLSPVEYVTTNARVDPDGNGRGTALLGGTDYYGYMQLENGGLRIVRSFDDPNKGYFYFCRDSSANLTYSLLLLGNPLKDMQGRWQITAVNLYPATKDKLYSIYIEKQIYESSSVLGPGVLSQ